MCRFERDQKQPAVVCTLYKTCYPATCNNAHRDKNSCATCKAFRTELLNSRLLNSRLSPSCPAVENKFGALLPVVVEKKWISFSRTGVLFAADIA